MKWQEVQPVTRTLNCGHRQLNFQRPKVMGILNITPDSFSDGGRFYRRGLDLGHVTETAVAMIEAGADLLDIGGESTRPGAEPVSGDEECRRVAPALERLLDLDVIVSVDTRKPQVARMAIRAGAHLINDVTGMTNPEMLEAVADSKVAVCLMHMQGDPGTMQEDPRYSDVVCEVRDFLALQSERCLSAGIGLDRLVLDPGFGFGKNIDHNLALLRDLPELRVHGLPLLVGLSRKRMIGSITDRGVADRKMGSVAAAMLAAQRGADILRVHDVGATMDALKMLAAVESSDLV